MTGTEFVLREEQVNAYKNLAVDQVESLRRLNRDWSLLKFLSSGSVYDNHAQQSVNYHERFPAISPKYGKLISNKKQLQVLKLKMVLLQQTGTGQA